MTRRNLCWVCVAAAIFANSRGLHSQVPRGKPGQELADVAFEVASVKPNPLSRIDAGRSILQMSPSGAFRAVYVTVRQLLMVTYDVKAYQIFCWWTVRLEDDLIAIFRLSEREMRLWRKFPEFIPFPPLPMLDRQIRASGCVVAWFLAQDSSEYYRSFKTPLEELVKGRGRARPPWWKFAPPHGERYRAVPLDGEKPSLSVDKIAAILRTSGSALRRAIRDPEFPMPPATTKPLRWTEGQIERLLWAPQDHSERQQKTRLVPARHRR